MKKPLRGIGLLLALALLLPACAQKGAKLQQSVVPPDKTLFENGEEYLKKNQYIKARLAFQTLINTYPDSEVASEAYMSIGDSFYDEGGTENLLQAEDQYKNFIIFFPTHPKAADAQLKIISVNMKMMRSPDRDQNYTERAEVEIKKFLDQFPTHEYAPYVRRYLDEVQENLAMRDFGVGQFYANRGNFLGTISRLKDIPDKYPGFSMMDETYFQLAQAMQMLQLTDQAALYYSKIAAGYPFSKRFEEAKTWLADSGKPVPSVDEKLAAENQAKLKPAEGFSPLRPLTDFAEALGFKGAPDRYEATRKEVEAQKAAAAQAAQDANSDDVLIKAVLTQDASGKKGDTAVLNSNPKGTGQATDKKNDKKDDKKKGDNKTPPPKPG